MFDSESGPPMVPGEPAPPLGPVPPQEPAPPQEPSPPQEPVPPFDPEELSAEEVDAWIASADAEPSGWGESDAGPGAEGPLEPERHPLLAEAAARVLDELEAMADRVDVMDADETLAAAERSRWAVYRAEARQLELAGHWADLHGVVTAALTTPGGERLFPVGGDGTPEVAEFAPAELAAVLGVREEAAASLMGDALDLRHRFPLLCQVVLAGSMEVWKARKIVQRARPLSREAAARVDHRIAGIAGGLTWGRLRRIVDAEILVAHPPQALSDAEQAAADCGAWINEETRCGYGTMIIRAASGDLDAMDRALSVIAEALTILGDTDPRQQRRARAVGILAQPTTAQHLIDLAERIRQLHVEAVAARKAGDDDDAVRLEAQAADLVATWTGEPPPAADEPAPPCRAARRPFAFSAAVMYIHLSAEKLAALLTWGPMAEAGVVRLDDIGPVLLDQVKAWLQHANVVVKPVIDLAGVPPVDRYEVTPTIAEAIGLRFPADYSPWSTSLSRRQDHDHTVPYRPMDEGGPPGQTDPAAMGRLARGRHRLKTHGGWTVRQVGPLAWLWRTRHGHHFLVDAHGTTALGAL